MMKTAKEIVKCIGELKLDAEKMEYWDGESDSYINEGWIEALRWVLGLRDKRDEYPREEWLDD